MAPQPTAIQSSLQKGWFTQEPVISLVIRYRRPRHTGWMSLARQRYWEISLSVEPKIPALYNSKNLLRTTESLGELKALTYSNL